MTFVAEHQPTGTDSADKSRVRAWACVGLIPVFFIVAFAVGEVLYAVLGYKPENDDAPLWVDLVTSLVALAVSLAPCVGAVIYGRRAGRAGRHGGRTPMAIGALAGTALVVLTALST